MHLTISFCTSIKNPHRGDYQASTFQSIQLFCNKNIFSATQEVNICLQVHVSPEVKETATSPECWIMHIHSVAMLR